MSQPASQERDLWHQVQAVLISESSCQLWMWTCTCISVARVWWLRVACVECVLRADSPFQDEDWASHVPSLWWAIDKEKYIFYHPVFSSAFSFRFINMNNGHDKDNIKHKVVPKIMLIIAEILLHYICFGWFQCSYNWQRCKCRQKI